MGTADVETSELVSQMLHKIGLPHEVLNAKNNAREAEIVALAGQKGQITISTNMAGRGTDIKLGEGVKELGGLAVLGTERHESRRIDNQLRGRSGRQGDPGFSQFFISAEDDLLVRFGGDTFKQRLSWVIKLNGEGDENKPLESKMFTKVVTQAQERIEGNNYDARKNVLRYDDVIRRQREIFYKERTEVISEDSIEPQAKNLIKDGISIIVSEKIKPVGNNKYDIDDEGITNTFNQEYFGPGRVDLEKIKSLDENEIVEYLNDTAMQILDEKRESCPAEVFEEVLKTIILRILDSNWTRHIDEMDGLRQGIGFQSYGQQNPLQLYQQEGFKKFSLMMDKIKTEVLRYLMRVQIRQNIKRDEDSTKNLATNAPDNALKPKPKVNKETNKKVGRNDPCPCGSGKKYKNCCGLNK